MSRAAREIKLDAIPGMGRSLLKAATTSKAKIKTPKLKPLTVSVAGVVANQTRLDLYREVCRCERGAYLPLTYPHIMAFALHIRLMCEPEFPFSALGLVHVHNRIRQTRSIRNDEKMDIVASLTEMKKVDKGYEVSIVTEARIDGERVWDDLSTILKRTGGGSSGGEKPAPAAPIEYTDTVNWQLAANKGRAYARASGDYNPLHLWSVTAKTMGFKRQIMHGMWSKTAAVAHLTPADHHGPLTADVSFKLPIFLPAEVQLQSTASDSGVNFEIRDSKGEIPHLRGKLRFTTDL